MSCDLWDTTIVRGTMKSVLLGQGVMSTVTKRITLIISANYVEIKKKKNKKERIKIRIT